MSVIDVDVPGVAIEVRELGGAGDVSMLDALSLDEVGASIKSIADTLGKAVQAASPEKASVEFGLQVAVKGGKLISLITEASGTATLKVTLEWGS